MKKILITGSRGRIGTDIKDFLKQDYKVIELVKGDELYEEKFNVDAVIHLAALTPRKDKDFSLNEYIKVNVEITKKVLFYSSRQNVKTIIIPTSWSWMFKLGDYQYSKLLQEKIGEKYKELGFNVILIELPEVINQNYTGIIQNILNRIQNNQETIVDTINISTITTKDIGKICKEFIDGDEKRAYDIYKRSIKTFDLYEKIKSITKKEFPDKLKYLKKGNPKIRTNIIKEDKTILFPSFE